MSWGDSAAAAQARNVESASCNGSDRPKHAGGFGREMESQLSSGFEPVLALLFDEDGPSCDEDVRLSDIGAVNQKQRRTSVPYDEGCVAWGTDRRKPTLSRPQLQTSFPYYLLHMKLSDFFQRTSAQLHDSYCSPAGTPTLEAKVPSEGWERECHNDRNACR